MFDIFIHPIHLLNRQEQPELPGFLACTAPRRAARNRSGDVLFVFVMPGGTFDPSPLFFEKVPQELADTYFNSSGSITSGMRASLEGLNEKLLKYNLDNELSGQSLSATINMAVLHNDQAYLVQSGPAHAMVLSLENVEDLYEPTASQGIGQNQATALRYYQTLIKAGDILLFWNNAPEEFLGNLKTGSGKFSLEQLRRRVLILSEADNRAVLLQFQQGSGQLRYLKPRAGVQASVVAEPIGPPVEDYVTTTPRSEQPGNPVISKEKIEAFPIPGDPIPEITAPLSPVIRAPVTVSFPTVEEETALGQATENSPDAQDEPVGQQVLPTEKSRQLQAKSASGGLLVKLISLLPGNSSGRKASSRRASSTQRVQAAATIPVTPTKFENEEDDEAGTGDRNARGYLKPPPVPRPDLRGRIARLWFGSRQAKQQVDENGKAILGRVLPGDGNDIPRLSPAMMLFIAVAVPLIVVTMATTIYFQNGPDKQHAYYLSQAKAIADQSKKQNDVTIRYQAWTEVIGLLDKAEKYDVTDASRLMRVQYQQKIDDFDGIYRLVFQPLALNLDSSIVISRLAANSTDVYMLDSTQGRVLRMTRTGQGYSYNLDSKFDCGPGNVGTNTVGSLVNFTLLPLNSPNNASILSMDADGNLLFCSPGISPLSITLPDPDKGVKLGNVVNFLLDGENLYVLDAKNNAIYIYVGYNLSFPDRPHLFFDLEVPNLKNVLDMEINGEDLFLLHEDGLMSRCTFRLFTFSQTRCIDPSPYQDTRKGREGEVPRFKNTHFTHLMVTTPPDPSLFLMDDLSSTLFQFGLSQTLHRQIRMQLYPDFSLPSRQVSAFTVSSDHLLWMAYGNELFFAQLQ